MSSWTVSSGRYQRALQLRTAFSTTENTEGTEELEDLCPTLVFSVSSVVQVFTLRAPCAAAPIAHRLRRPPTAECRHPRARSRATADRRAATALGSGAPS